MKYKTVVIDFPWKVQNGFNKHQYVRFGGKLPYDVMTDKQIRDFPINDFADKNCDLFLWVTHSKLELGLELLKSWGFTYHVCISWDKMGGIGMIGFDRRNELCLYGYRGKMGIDKSPGKYIPTVIREQRTTHSTKPKSFYDILQKRTLEPRIDMFARKTHEGFEAWGNEVEEALTIDGFL